MCSIFLYTTAAILIFYIFLDITWRIWKRKYNFLPSAPNIPWLGSLPFIGSTSRDFYETFTTFCKKYDHFYVLWIGPKPVIACGSVEYVEHILKSQRILKKSSVYNSFCEWLGYGLLTSCGKKWKKRRSALTPAFHFSILNDFVEVFETQANKLINRLAAISDGHSIEVQALTRLTTLDILCETSMGVELNSLKSHGSVQFVQAVNEIKIQLVDRVINPLLWPKYIYQFTSAGKLFYHNLKVLHSFTTNIINKNIDSRRCFSNGCVSEVKRKKVFLDILLDLYDKEEIDFDGIREEVDTFIFEGHDTTSSALSWILYEIGAHPKILDKLIDEADKVNLLQISLRDKIRSLKYLENVIKESLRMHPAVPIFGRLLEEPMLINKYVIPAGTEIFVESHSIHMNEKYWKCPTIFNPDRFETDEFSKRNPYCYIPFSAGPRNCIGQKFAMREIKVIVYCILLKYRWKSLQQMSELGICIDVIKHAENGIYINFVSR